MSAVDSEYVTARRLDVIDLLITVAIAAYLVSIVGGLLLAPRKGVPMGWTLLATWIGGPIGLFYLLSLPDVD